MQTDLQIARAATKRPINDIAARLGLTPDQILPYGHDKAKITHDALAGLTGPEGRLILVTAINPTPAGEGKTTTTVGLGDALNRIGHRATICIREASLGPNFGMKGGAAGGGRAQIVPMEEMNLHFTGDFHAITSDATVMSKPVWRENPFAGPPSPTTTSRSARSFMSMTRRQTIRRWSMSSALPQ